jgi:hypothetical protein
VIDTNGCAATDQIEVTISDTSMLQQNEFPTKHFWNSKTQAFKDDILNELDDEVFVFPNPANDFLQIEINTSHQTTAESKIELFNLLGKTVYSTALNFAGNLSHSINLKRLPAGEYWLRINLNEMTTSKPIIVIH